MPLRCTTGCRRRCRYVIGCRWYARRAGCQLDLPPRQPASQLTLMPVILPRAMPPDTPPATAAAIRRWYCRMAEATLAICSHAQPAMPMARLASCAGLLKIAMMAITPCWYHKDGHWLRTPNSRRPSHVTPAAITASHASWRHYWLLALASCYGCYCSQRPPLMLPAAIVSWPVIFATPRYWIRQAEGCISFGIVINSHNTLMYIGYAISHWPPLHTAVFIDTAGCVSLNGLAGYWYVIEPLMLYCHISCATPYYAALLKLRHCFSAQYYQIRWYWPADWCY